MGAPRSATPRSGYEGPRRTTRPFRGGAACGPTPTSSKGVHSPDAAVSGKDFGVRLGLQGTPRARLRHGEALSQQTETRLTRCLVGPEKEGCHLGVTDVCHSGFWTNNWT